MSDDFNIAAIGQARASQQKYIYFDSLSIFLVRLQGRNIQRYLQYVQLIQNMKMSVMCPKRPQHLALTQAFTCQTYPPHEIQQEKEHTSTFQLTSGLISHKIEPLQMSIPSRTLLKIEPQQSKIITLNLKKFEKPQEVSTALRRSLIKLKDMTGKGAQVTLVNFQKYLRDIWIKDPSLNLDELFEIAKRLYHMIDESQRQLVNLSRRWCNRFLKTLKGIPSQELKDKDKDDIAEDIYEVFSQPESAQMEANVHNTSEQWRQHTWKLLMAKYPGQIDGKKKEEQKSSKGQMWITIEKRSCEMLRLQQDQDLMKRPIKIPKIKLKEKNEVVSNVPQTKQIHLH